MKKTVLKLSMVLLATMGASQAFAFHFCTDAETQQLKQAHEKLAHKFTEVRRGIVAKYGHGVLEGKVTAEEKLEMNSWGMLAGNAETMLTFGVCGDYLEPYLHEAGLIK